MKTRIAIGLLISAAAAFGLRNNFEAGGPSLELDTNPNPSQPEVQSAALLAGTGEQSRSNIPGAKAEEFQSGGCEFFEPWMGSECTLDNVVGLFKTIENTANVDLECVPADWLVLAIFANCDGKLPLSGEDVDRITQSIGPRMPNPLELAKTPTLARVAPQSLSCFIHNLIPEGAEQDEIAQAWAWGLMAMFGEKGDMWTADPNAVAALEFIMIEWPLFEDNWWKSLWSALPGDPHMQSLNVRIAMYEALHGILPQKEWLDRMGVIVSLEEYNTVGSHGLWVAGNALQKHIPKEDYAYLFGSKESPEWQRALVFGFPNGLSWPAQDHSLVPESVKGMIADLRDADDYEHRTELLNHQWSMLGPQLAMADLDHFVFSRERSTMQWELEAAHRVRAAVQALDSLTDEYQRQNTEWLLRNLLQFSSPSEVRRILDKCNEQQMNGAWKEKVVQFMGEHWLAELSNKHRGWFL